MFVTNAEGENQIGIGKGTLIVKFKTKEIKVILKFYMSKHL